MFKYVVIINTIVISTYKYLYHMYNNNNKAWVLEICSLHKVTQIWFFKQQKKEFM
jgi:hypothetical protein